jgi:hypothetical protein
MAASLIRHRSATKMLEICDDDRTGGAKRWSPFFDKTIAVGVFWKICNRSISARSM